jgi:CubicO group peptidase (beta-lactamase class C family)
MESKHTRMTTIICQMRDAIALLDLYSRQHMQVNNVPGMAVALTGGDRLLYVGTYGFADLAARRPVVPETLFQIGSISKSFTALVLLQLHEAGLVDLQAPVSHYLPWFHVPSRHEPITPHHLLSHTSGIIQGSDFSTEARYEVWSLRETEAIAPPGARFHYSNAGYKALGLVLESVLDQSYGRILYERILGPLGMDATEPVITHDTRRGLAVGYERCYDDRPAHPDHPLVPATWFESATADGSISATAADLATYVRMLINHGRGPRDRLLAEESFALMIGHAVELPEEDREHANFYGYGLEIGELDGHTIIGHGGGMVGYYSAILADLDDRLGAVVLTNGPGDPEEVARFALKLLCLHCPRSRTRPTSRMLQTMPVGTGPVPTRPAYTGPGTRRSAWRTRGQS